MPPSHSRFLPLPRLQQCLKHPSAQHTVPPNLPPAPPLALLGEKFGFRRWTPAKILVSEGLTWAEEVHLCYSLLDRWDCVSWTPSNNFRSELLPHKRNKFSCSVQQVPTHILQICTGACRLAQGCWQHQNNALRAKESEYSWVWDWGRGLFGGWYIWVFKNKQISHRDTLDPSRLMVSTGSSMS